MQLHDIAVVGSGIGGSLSAALNADKKTILFEKEPNLGGCASTFKRFGQRFNSGATTFAGYEDGHVVKNLFDRVNCIPNISESKIAIRILQNNNQIDRTTNFEEFLVQINEVYPHPNNEKFWMTIREIDQQFWENQNIYLGKYSIKRYYKSFLSFMLLSSKFKMKLFKNARDFIDEILPDISQKYLDFIDAQLLITVQTNSQNISLLSMALGLSYPFHKVYYANGGMGQIFEDLTKHIELHRKEPVESIKKQKDTYILTTNKDQYESKCVILNSTIYDSSRLFENKEIQNYYEKFLFSDQSAFVVYMHIDSKEDFLHHYQIILDEVLPYSISKSFFVSFSDKYDEKLCKNGYTITISTHTKAYIWKDLDINTYDARKVYLEQFIINKFLEEFDNIQKSDIINSFSATATTFERYINRLNCGGQAISIKNALKMATPTTPFKGLYNVGDTIFSGQGWPGVAMGVQILQKEIDEYFRT